MASGDSLTFRIGVFIVTTLVVAFLITVLIYFNQVKGCVSCLTETEINTVMIIGGILLAFNLILWVWAIIRLFFGRQKKKEPMAQPGLNYNQVPTVQPKPTYNYNQVPMPQPRPMYNYNPVPMTQSKPTYNYNQVPMTLASSSQIPSRYPYSNAPDYVPETPAPVYSPTVISPERTDSSMSSNQADNIPINTVLNQE